MSTLPGRGVRLAGFIFAERRDLRLCLRAGALARDEVPPFHAREAFEIAIAANAGVASGSCATGDRLTFDHDHGLPQGADPARLRAQGLHEAWTAVRVGTR
jgi:hypothetical protein